MTQSSTPPRAATEVREASGLGAIGLSVRFGAGRGAEGHWALRDVSIDVRPGSFTVIVGRSGSGKSTLLRTLAGLQQPTAGRVLYGALPVAVGKRELRYVFQDYGQSLFPWLSVIGNVRFGATQGGVPPSERGAVATEALTQVGLAHVAAKRTWQLSGGMQQRVAIARALASRPRVILLDEPFGAVDALSRAWLQDVLLKVWEQTGLTVVFVTHDIDEAIYLGDRVVVMDPAGHGLAADVDIALDRPRDQLATR